MTEKETILAICKRLGILEHEGPNFIHVTLPHTDEEVAEIWFNNDETVDFITSC